MPPHLTQLSPPPSEKHKQQATSTITMSILDNHIESGLPKTWDVCDSLLKNGEFDQFRKAFLMGYPLDGGTFKEVILSGSLDTLRLLVVHGARTNSNRSMRPAHGMYAAQYGHLHICKWIHEMGLFPRDDFVFLMGAARGGHIAIMEWARSIGVSWEYESSSWLQGMKSSACIQAVLGGQFEALKWAFKEGCPMDGTSHGQTVCGFAVEAGDLVMLKWARKKGFPWGNTPGFATSIAIFNWLKRNGCPWVVDDIAVFPLE